MEALLNIVNTFHLCRISRLACAVVPTYWNHHSIEKYVVEIFTSLKYSPASMAVCRAFPAAHFIHAPAIAAAIAAAPMHFQPNLLKYGSRLIFITFTAFRYPIVDADLITRMQYDVPVLQIGVQLNDSLLEL